MANSSIKLHADSSKKKIKLLFAGHDFKFLKDIIASFESHENFSVKTDIWKNSIHHNPKPSIELLEWADVIFAEWCLANAVWYSQNKLPHQKLFIRFHRVEMTTIFVSMLNWNNVNRMVFIAPYIQQHVTDLFNLPKNKCKLIYNAIDTAKYRLAKTDDSIFNIGVLGFCPKLKRPDKAIEVFEKLKQLDDRYTLYFKGRHPSEYGWIWNKPVEKEYYEQLFSRIEQSPYRDSIKFEGWGDNIPHWFQKIGFLLSTSDIEGSHQAVAEAMASGTIPLIHGDWEGSELLYPSELIQRDQSNLVNTIICYSNNRELYHKIQHELVRYANKHFDIEKIMNQWVHMIRKFIKPRKT